VTDGAVIERAALWGTAVFVVTSVLAALLKSFEIVALFVSLLLFTAGTATFLWALVVAAGRSREREMTVAGLFLLQGSAPRDVRRRLLGALAAEVVVGLSVAIARPFTSLAFGLLVPVYGLALAGLWGARHGTFPPRRPASPRKQA
jgi:hypothetical protein